MIDAGPAFDAVLETNGTGFIFPHLVDLARADLNAVSTTLAFLFIHYGIHVTTRKEHDAKRILDSRLSRNGIPNRWQAVSTFFCPYQFAKRLRALGYAFVCLNLAPCAMQSLTDLFRAAG